MDHKTFLARIAGALARLGNTPLEPRLAEVCWEDFDYIDLRIADELLSHPKRDTLWRLTPYGAARDWAGAGPAVCFDTFELAVARIAELVDLNQPRFTAFVPRPNGGFQLVGDSGPLVTLEIVKFSTAPAQLVTRVRTALKGVGKRERHRLAERLRQIPGFQSIVLKDPERKFGPLPSGGELIGSVYLKDPSSWASAFRKSLSRRCGLELPQAHAQHVLAMGFGFKNWAHLVSSSDDRVLSSRAFEVYSDNNLAFGGIYRDVSEALAALAHIAYDVPDRFDVLLGMSGLPCLVDKTGALGMVGAGPDEAEEPEPRYVIEARQALAAPEPLAAMQLLFGMDGATHRHIAALDQRRGAARSLDIGGWHFTIISAGDRERLLGSMYRDNVCISQLGPVDCYKASIVGTQQKGGAALMADYERERILDLSSFSKKEVAEFSAFAGIARYEFIPTMMDQSLLPGAPAAEQEGASLPLH